MGVVTLQAWLRVALCCPLASRARGTPPGPSITRRNFLECTHDTCVQPLHIREQPEHGVSRSARRGLGELERKISRKSAENSNALSAPERRDTDGETDELQDKGTRRPRKNHVVRRGQKKKELLSRAGVPAVARGVKARARRGETSDKSIDPPARSLVLHKGISGYMLYMQTRHRLASRVNRMRRPRGGHQAFSLKTR